MIGLFPKQVYCSGTTLHSNKCTKGWNSQCWLSIDVEHHGIMRLILRLPLSLSLSLWFSVVAFTVPPSVIEKKKQFFLFHTREENNPDILPRPRYIYTDNESTMVNLTSVAVSMMLLVLLLLLCGGGGRNIASKDSSGSSVVVTMMFVNGWIPPLTTSRSRKRCRCR